MEKCKMPHVVLDISFPDESVVYGAGSVNSDGSVKLTYNNNSVVATLPVIQSENGYTFGSWRRDPPFTWTSRCSSTGFTTLTKTNKIQLQTSTSNVDVYETGSGSIEIVPGKASGYYGVLTMRIKVVALSRVKSDANGSYITINGTKYRENGVFTSNATNVARTINFSIEGR